VINKGMEKICSKCKVEKPLSDFSKRKSRPSGYSACCKMCRNIHFKNKGLEKPITQIELFKILSYDSETGIFRHLIKKGGMSF
jgi:hypothetical protein